MDNTAINLNGDKVLAEVTEALKNTCNYLEMDRKTASLDVDKYASAISKQNEQMNTQMELFMKMFESLSSDVKGLAEEVKENTKVTLNFEAQRDTLTSCLVEMRAEQKEQGKALQELKLEQAEAKVRQEAEKELTKERQDATRERQDAAKEFSVVGQGWLKWVIGGILIVLGAAAKSLLGTMK